MFKKQSALNYLNLSKVSQNPNNSRKAYSKFIEELILKENFEKAQSESYDTPIKTYCKK